MAFPVTGYFRITNSEGTLTAAYQLITFPKRVYSITFEHRGLKGEGDMIIDLIDGSLGTGGAPNDNFSIPRGCSKTWTSKSGTNTIYVKSSSATVPSDWEIGSSR